MRAAYTGHEALTFSDYIDLDTGRTLAAEPGGTYDIAPASGRLVPEIPEPWFTAAEPKALEAGPDLFSAEADPEPAPEPAPETGSEEG